jgi:hypothetical protein
MTIIQNPPPPRLPDPEPSYSRGYLDSLLNVLRLYFNRLFGVLQALFGTNGGAELQMPHAMLMSNQDQLNAGITSENIITYNQTIISQGVEVRSGSEIWFDRTGQYLVTFSLMFTNRGNAAQIIEVWAKEDGNNYPLSNTRIDIAARKSESVWSHAVATITGIFTVTDPDTNYLRIAWWSDGADVFLEHYPVGTSPARPEIPSVIMTVSFVSRLP